MGMDHDKQHISAVSLHLPPAGIPHIPYIPSLSRLTHPDPPPNLIATKGVVTAPDLVLLGNDEEGHEAIGQLWHRLDSSFRQPRAYVRAVLATPAIQDGGPVASESARIMSDILYKA